MAGFPAVHLLRPGGHDPHVHVGEVTKALLPYLPGVELVVVQGDTSSALGGALAAAAARIPLAHVEAGLRTHDLSSPWPEEDFRSAIDADAELLFAPTELSAANLRREGVSGQIHVTGNSGIDSVLKVKSRLGAIARVAGPVPKLLVTCHRRENWGSGLAGVARALRSIGQQKIAAVDLILHPNPATAAHMRTLLLGACGIRLHAPLGHEQTVAAMLSADCVLSDSGGMQEECAALGIPLLVLRDRTERPEAIACGRMRLVGTDPDRIVAAVRTLGRKRWAASAGLPYGDGRAALRIAAIIEEWMHARGSFSPALPNLRRLAAIC